MMAKKSERGKRALATIMQASGVSHDAVIRVLAAAQNSALRAEAMEYANYLYEEGADKADSHKTALNAAVDLGTAELGLKPSLWWEVELEKHWGEGISTVETRRAALTALRQIRRLREQENMSMSKKQEEEITS